MSLRIAEICFSPSWGGLEHYFVDCCRRLTIRGHYVLPIACSNSPSLEKLGSSQFHPFGYKPLNYFSPLFTFRLSRLLKSHKIDSVHLHRTQDLGTVLPACDLASVNKRVFTLQMESKRKKKDYYHKFVYSRLTKMFTLTERMKNLVVENVAVDPGIVKCLYYGIDPVELSIDAQTRAQIRAKWQIDSDAFIIGIVGRLEEYKGQNILLDAISIVEKHIPNLCILIVGDETVGQSGFHERLRKKASSLSSARVIFTGYQHPPGSIVPAFDVSILASKKESFGLVVIEAQAFGIPVIATDAGGVPEIIESRTNGILVPPLSPKPLAEAIVKLFEDEKLRIKIGRAGHENVLKRFSMQRHLNRLEEALEP